MSKYDDFKSRLQEMRGTTGGGATRSAPPQTVPTGTDGSGALAPYTWAGRGTGIEDFKNRLAELRGGNTPSSATGTGASSVSRLTPTTGGQSGGTFGGRSGRPDNSINGIFDQLQQISVERERLNDVDKNLDFVRGQLSNLGDNWETAYANDPETLKWARDAQASISEVETNRRKLDDKEKELISALEEQTGEDYETYAKEHGYTDERTWLEKLLDSVLDSKPLNNAVDFTGKAVYSGLSKIAKGTANTLDLFVGKPLQALGWENNPLSVGAENMNYYDDLNTKALYEAAGDSRAAQITGELLSTSVAALPMALSALFTGGASLLGEAGTAGLQMISASQNMNFVSRLGQAVNMMMKNPSYWMSFIQEAGNDFHEAQSWAKNDGVAAIYAITAGLINSGIEVGLDGASGIQGFEQSVREGNFGGLGSWLNSMGEEGLEEIRQGFVSRGLAKLMGSGAPLYSETDPDAVFNPYTSLEEGAMGAAAAGLLTGGQIAGQGALNLFRSRVAGMRGQSQVETAPGQDARTAAPDSAPESITSPGQSQNGPDSSVIEDMLDRVIGSQEETVREAGNEGTPTMEPKSIPAALNGGTGINGSDVRSSVDSLTRGQRYVNTIVEEALAHSKNGRIDLTSIAQQFSDRADIDPEAAQGMADAYKTLLSDGRYALDADGKIYKTGGETDLTIDQRQEDSFKLGDRKINAFQFDHPEVHKYYIEAARWLLLDLKGTVRGERIFNYNPETGGAPTVTGIKRSTTAPIETMLDEYRLTYARIEDVLNRIINDQGQENIADAKRVEMILDDMLQNGYTDIEGHHIGPNEEYLETLKSLGQITENEGQRRNPLDGETPEILNQKAQEVYRAAARTQAELDAVLRDVAEQIGAEALSGGQKSVDSMVEKVTRKRAAGTEYGFHDIKDHARGALMLRDFSQVPDVLSALRSRGLSVNAEAVGPTEWGYRGLHLTWRDAQGLSSEVQITRQDVWRVKKISDEIYEKWRNVADVFELSDTEYAQRMQELQQSRKMWDQLDLPDFSVYEASSASDSTRAFQTSSPETGREGLTQTPLTNSRTLTEGSGDMSSTRPDSVRQAISSPPSVSTGSIAQSDTPVNTELARDGLGAADRGFARSGYNDWVENAEEFHPEGENAVRNASLPTRNLEGVKTSKVGQTVMEAANTTDERVIDIENAYLNGKLTIDTRTNAGLVRDAVVKITQDPDAALNQWTRDVRDGKVSPELVATGAALLDSEKVKSNGTLFMDVLTDYVKLCSTAGQALQAQRIYKALSPEGRLYMVKKAAEGLSGDIGEQLTISGEDADAVLAAKTDEEMDAALDRVYQHLADQLPAKFSEKWTALRYMNMLGNFKTQIRNLAGNTLMSGMRAVKNEVAAVIEDAVARNNPDMERTQSARVGKAWMDAAKADFENVREAAQGNGRYDDTSRTGIEQEIQSRRRIFKTRPLEAYRKLTNWATNAGDEVFIKHHYARALAGYLKVNGVQVEQFLEGNVDQQLLNRATDFAIREAQEATFHDNNAFSDWVSKIGRRETTPKAVKIVAEGVAPFRKTPANVLARAYEYSPLGLIDTVTKAVNTKNGTATSSDVINSAARVLTGSGIMALGLALRAAGYIRGTGNDDDETIDALMNRQDYSVVIPGKGSYTIDWLTPATMPLFMGANLWDIIEDGEMSLADIDSVLAKFTEPILETSMLSGVNDAISNVKFSENHLMQMAATYALSWLTQGLTNTLLGQVERASEPNRMTTYVSSDNAVPDWLERILGQASAKIPGLDIQQTEYLDELGNTEPNGSLIERILENIFSPGYWTESHEGEPLYDSLQKLHDQTGEAPWPDAYPPKSFTVDGEKHTLTQEDKERYQETRGSIFEELAEEILNKKSAFTPEELAEIVAGITSYAGSQAKQEYFDENDIDATASVNFITKAVTARDEADIPLETYIGYWARSGNLEYEKGVSGAKKKAVMELINSLDLTPEQKDWLYLDAGYAKSTIDAAPWH